MKDKREHKEHDTLNSSFHNKKNEGVSKKFVVMAVIMGLLILVAGVQAVELVSLKNKLNSGLSTLSASSGKTSTSSGASLPNNLQNLPSMVGGC